MGSLQITTGSGLGKVECASSRPMAVDLANSL